MTDTFIRAQLEAMRYLNPQQFNNAIGEISSMDRESYVSRLREMAKQKGVDLDKLAMQYGIRL